MQKNKNEFIHRGYSILTWVEIVDGFLHLNGLTMRKPLEGFFTEEGGFPHILVDKVCCAPSFWAFRFGSLSLLLCFYSWI